MEDTTRHGIICLPRIPEEKLRQIPSLRYVIALGHRVRDREADLKLGTSPLVFSEHCIIIAIRWETSPSFPRFVSLAGGKSVWRPPDVNHDRS
jgi:hypothetical protein